MVSTSGPSGYTYEWITLTHPALVSDGTGTGTALSSSAFAIFARFEAFTLFTIESKSSAWFNRLDGWLF